MTKSHFIKGTKFEVQKVFVNKRNGQMTIILPKKKMKTFPTRVQVTFW